MCEDPTSSSEDAPSGSCITIGLRWLFAPPSPERRDSMIIRSGTVLRLAESSPPTRGHRFPARQQPPTPISPLSPSYNDEKRIASRASYASAEEAGRFFVQPPADAPHVLLLDPGSGESCAALQMSSIHVHLAAAPAYDVQVKRYPPHWKSMVGVRLTEAEAAADAALPVPKSSWPGVHDLRGPAFPKNLATWASVLYDAEGGCMRAVDLSATGADRTAARALPPSSVSTGALSCIVCGSRGGQVTLPALWRLGCTLPCVVINGGCAREPAGWLWPPGVSVVLLTGGRDTICNEFARWPAERRDDAQQAFLEQTWRAVPEASRPTTAIVHIPAMGHRPEAELLRALLPPLVAWAASGLASDRKPTAEALRGVDGAGEAHGALPCTLVTAQHPEGEQLLPFRLPSAVDVPPLARVGSST